MVTKMSTFKQFRSPQTVISRFVARRTMRSATLWAAVFGAYVASKSAGFAAAYPTAHDRVALAATFGSNIGFKAILGTPRNLDTVTGFTAWNCLIIITIVGSIWAFLLATKNFRGEEAAGRWELLLTSQTTARRAAANVLAGLGASLVVLYVVTAITFVLVGRIHTVDFSTGSALFFALASVCGAAMFMALGALASQLMPTRARAAGLTAAVFGICFLVRAAADTTTAHWLLNITPLGWIEQLQPLNGPQSLWLLPIASLVVVAGALTIWLAGRRDLGESIFADADTAKPHTALLRSPLAVALRLTRMANFGWLLGITVIAAFFGLLTKPAAQALNESASAANIISKLGHTSPDVGAAAFLGVIFLLIMTFIMAYAASSVGAMREDEAEGYLDNLLVRPVSRQRWLWGRIGLAAVVIVLASFLSGAVTYLAEAAQQGGISFHTLLLAGLNICAPALLVLGIGICALGLIPRLTTIIAYGIIAWSFLVEMVSSGLNLSHWVLDTSILYHMALAPGVDPTWGTNAVLAGLGLALCIIGAIAFNRRDLESE